MSADYEEVQDFQKRFQSLRHALERALTQSGMFCARLHDFPDDPECAYVAERLAEMNETLAVACRQIRPLEGHLY